MFKKLTLVALMFSASNVFAVSNYEIRLPSGSSTVVAEAESASLFTAEESLAAWTQFSIDIGTTYSSNAGINVGGLSIQNSAPGSAYAGDGKLPNEPIPDSVIIGNIYGYTNSLTNVDGFSGLVTANSSIHFEGGQITNLDGFSDLTSVGGYFTFYNNQLTNVDGLRNLTTVGQFLHLNENLSLTDVSGLANLTSVPVLRLDLRDYTVKAPANSPLCQAIGTTVLLPGTGHATKAHICES